MKWLERLIWALLVGLVFLLGRWDHVSPALQALRDQVRAELHARGVPWMDPGDTGSRDH